MPKWKGHRTSTLHKLLHETKGQEKGKWSYLDGSRVTEMKERETSMHTHVNIHIYVCVHVYIYM